jgi:hypothetical protein
MLAATSSVPFVSPKPRAVRGLQFDDDALGGAAHIECADVSWRIGTETLCSVMRVIAGPPSCRRSQRFRPWLPVVLPPVAG